MEMDFNNDGSLNQGSNTPDKLNQKGMTNAKLPGSKRTIDIFVLIAIIFWFTERLVIFVLTTAAPQWYNSWVKYLNIGLNMVFAFVPIVFALSIRNRTLKIIAIVMSALISLYILYSNTDWLIREIKYQ